MADGFDDAVLGQALPSTSYEQRFLQGRERSDIYSLDLLQSVPESLGACRRQAIGTRPRHAERAAPSAKNTIANAARGPNRNAASARGRGSHNPEAWECASAFGLFWFACANLWRPSVTLRPDKGAGLVSFFNFPWLDRSSEKWRATVLYRRSRGVGALCRVDAPVQRYCA